MITVKEFITAVQENADRIREYEWGKDGGDGKSDCIGLIIGALSLLGFSWPGVHGTNWAARNAMDGLVYIDSAAQLFLGEIVFKAREPGEAGYDLPSAYAGSGDLRDYYHVGVVTSVSPLCVTHCTSVEGGIQRDSSLGKWRWGGKLKYVNYDYDESEGGGSVGGLYRARVWADNGYPVKMRKLPGTQSAVLLQVPLGSVVEVTGEVNETWAAVIYQGKSGYMMRKFLIPLNGEENDALIEIRRIRELLQEAMDALDRLIEGEERK